MPTSERTLTDLFLEMLRNFYSAEKQIVVGLAQMSKMRGAEGLALAFDSSRLHRSGIAART
jgi:ferritin-like metal-binding protein YciE